VAGRRGDSLVGSGVGIGNFGSAGGIVGCGSIRLAGSSGPSFGSSGISFTIRVRGLGSIFEDAKKGSG